jgi:hypothetical protein
MMRAEAKQALRQLRLSTCGRVQVCRLGAGRSAIAHETRATDSRRVEVLASRWIPHVETHAAREWERGEDVASGACSRRSRSGRP